MSPNSTSKQKGNESLNSVLYCGWRCVTSAIFFFFSFLFYLASKKHLRVVIVTSTPSTQGINSVLILITRNDAKFGRPAKPGQGHLLRCILVPLAPRAQKRLSYVSEKLSTLGRNINLFVGWPMFTINTVII